jgi:hypothetical protein
MRTVVRGLSSAAVWPPPLCDDDDEAAAAVGCGGCRAEKGKESPLVLPARPPPQHTHTHDQTHAHAHAHAHTIVAAVAETRGRRKAQSGRQLTEHSRRTALLFAFTLVRLLLLLLLCLPLFLPLHLFLFDEPRRLLRGRRGGVVQLRLRAWNHPDDARCLKPPLDPARHAVGGATRVGLHAVLPPGIARVLAYRREQQAAVSVLAQHRVQAGVLERAHAAEAHGRRR